MVQLQLVVAKGLVGSNLGRLKTGQHNIGNNSTCIYFIWVKVDWVTNGLGKRHADPYFHE